MPQGGAAVSGCCHPPSPPLLTEHKHMAQQLIHCSVLTPALHPTGPTTALHPTGPTTALHPSGPTPALHPSGPPRQRPLEETPSCLLLPCSWDFLGWLTTGPKLEFYEKAAGVCLFFRLFSLSIDYASGTPLWKRWTTRKRKKVGRRC